MILHIDFGPTIGNRKIELPSLTESGYNAIAKFFIPRLNSPDIKSRVAISDAFIFAIQQAPKENPSDLWHHVLYRIYVKNKQGTNPEQSWVRTSGEGLENMLVRHYNPALEVHGVRLLPLFSRNEKREALDRMGIAGQVGSSKVDVVIEKRDSGIGRSPLGWGIIGGLHVKASLAERVSDDIPASRIMMNAGLASILVTLDVKSFPPPHGDLVNRGEFGSPTSPSDKRHYIESHGDFSACFSYNSRTVPSPSSTSSGKRIYVLSFCEVADTFVEYLKDVGKAGSAST